ARWLTQKGLRVGLITNDQCSQLVDTLMLSTRGFPVEEIAGGCFCCRFNSLLEAAGRLTQQNRPEVFIAEPVGSCTDLVATVTYPLRRMYGENFSIAPLSVLVDPTRAARLHGLAEGGKFSEKVLYIYRKQLEEADLIVINKIDMVSAEFLASLHTALALAYPRAEIFEVSARTGAGLEDWFAAITSREQAPRASMEVDYEEYAEGEARLGWLNATFQLAARQPLDANSLLQQLAAQIQQRLNDANLEVAHLKMTLEPDTGLGDLAVINLVRNDFVPELSQTLEDPLEGGQLIINLRAEAEPEVLRRTISDALQSCLRLHPELAANWEHTESFKPGKPMPTHRMSQ
ncbi:MAG TPA: GTP-binding protein, partial [Verrucomicrobiae bacterium]|nr:GTP-binding protein [Verrucomicrobiae bacterium]